MLWNVLVVDDDQAQAEITAELISQNKVSKDFSIQCSICSSFPEALERIKYSKFDLLILDLKDEKVDSDGHDKTYSGEKILQSLRESHFTPVVFYTGYAAKIEEIAGPFVKIVAKGSVPNLRSAIFEIFQTQLPQLLRHVQEEQRKYLWDHVDKVWQKDALSKNLNELAFLMARRLANALDGSVIRRFFDPQSLATNDIAHPIELYVWPPVNEALGFCDILKRTQDGRMSFYIVLNPACDFSQGKTEKALLAQCSELEEMSEYIDIKKGKKDGVEISKTQTSNLKSLLSDRRQGKGIQPDRYKFLPGTTFLPNLVVDFQNLSQIDINEIVKDKRFERVATLDAPFAESLQSRFIRYYGRIGTPDLEFDTLMDQIIAGA